MANQITVESGALSGQRFWLRAGQTIQVGRTELGDCCIRDDELMSRLHFAIDYEKGVCRLRDLGSRNGTFVNGKLTRSSILNDGDTILAGKTRFAVSLDTSESDSQYSESDSQSEGDVRWKPTPKPTAPIEATRTIVDSPIDLSQGSDLDSTQYSGPAPGSREVYDDEETLCVDPSELLNSPIVSPPIGQTSSPIDLEGSSASSPIVPAGNAPVESPPSTPSPIASPQSTASSGQQSLRDSLQETVGPNGISVLSPIDRHSRPLDVARVLVDNPSFYLMLNINRMEAAAKSYFSSPIQGQKFSRVADHLILISKGDAVDNFEVFCRRVRSQRVDWIHQHQPQR